jgi:hypothetical protein
MVTIMLLLCCSAIAPLPPQTLAVNKKWVKFEHCTPYSAKKAFDAGYHVVLLQRTFTHQPCPRRTQMKTAQHGLGVKLRCNA